MDARRPVRDASKSYSSSIPSAGSICSRTGCRYSTRPGTDCFAAAPAAISSSELPPRFHSRESSEVPTWIRFGFGAPPPSPPFRLASRFPSCFASYLQREEERGVRELWEAMACV